MNKILFTVLLTLTACSPIEGKITVHSDTTNAVHTHTIKCTQATQYKCIEYKIYKVTKD